MRVLGGVVVGTAMAAAAAVVYGDYPLSGSIPWLAALIIPALVGLSMTAIAGRRKRALWALTAPLGAASLAWGVRIATGWGLDPVPVSVWASMGFGLLWPLAWAVLRRDQRSGDNLPANPGGLASHPGGLAAHPDDLPANPGGQSPAGASPAAGAAPISAERSDRPATPAAGGN
jgi:hypothetical protein